MKNNWDNILTDNETIQSEFSIGDRYRKRSLLIWLLVGAFLLIAYGIGLFIILIVVFYWLFYMPRARQYALTNERILIKRGWLNTQLLSVDYLKITDVQVHESFLSKQLYKTGTLIINTAGTSEDEVTLVNIENPHQIRKDLLNLADRTKQPTV